MFYVVMLGTANFMFCRHVACRQFAFWEIFP